MFNLEEKCEAARASFPNRLLPAILIVAVVQLGACQHSIETAPAEEAIVEEVVTEVVEETTEVVTETTEVVTETTEVVTETTETTETVEADTSADTSDVEAVGEGDTEMPVGCCDPVPEGGETGPE